MEELATPKLILNFFLNPPFLRQRADPRYRAETAVVIDQGEAPGTLLSQRVVQGAIDHQEEDSRSRLVVKGLLPGQEAIIDPLSTTIQFKLPQLSGEVLFNVIKDMSYFIRSLVGKLAEHCHLKQTILMESGFNRRCEGSRDVPLLPPEGIDLQRRAIGGQHDSDIQLLLARPLQKLTASLAPLTSEGRGERILRDKALDGQYAETKEKQPHGKTLHRGNFRRKRSRWQGSMLIEVSLSIGILLFTSLYVLRTNLQTVRPRNWTMVQAVTDAYMSGPQARANAIPFEDLVAAGSPWPVFPATNVSAVQVGQLPFGRVLTGRLVQTREPSPTNLPSAGGTGTEATNPAETESWILQSHLTYTIQSRTYVKSRTSIRTR